MIESRTYFIISRQGNQSPLLARFKWGKWKRKKGSFVCDVEMQVGKSLKFVEEGELK